VRLEFHPREPVKEQEPQVRLTREEQGRAAGDARQNMPPSASMEQVRVCPCCTLPSSWDLGRREWEVKVAAPA